VQQVSQEQLKAISVNNMNVSTTRLNRPASLSSTSLADTGLRSTADFVRSIDEFGDNQLKREMSTNSDGYLAPSHEPSCLYAKAPDYLEVLNGSADDISGRPLLKSTINDNGGQAASNT